MFEELVHVRSLTYEYVGDIVLLLDKDRNFRVYPSGGNYLEEVVAHRKDISLYDVNNSSDTFTCYKILANRSAFEGVWNFSVAKAMEKIHAWERGKPLINSKGKITFVSNKRFRSLADSTDYILLLASQTAGKKLTLYLINERHGALESLIFIYEDVPAAKPIMKVFENIVLVAFHYQDETRDRLAIVELTTADEVGDTDTEGYRPVFITRASRKGNLFPLNSYLQFSWRIFGVTAFYNEGAVCVAVLDEEGSVHLYNPDKLKKGSNYNNPSSEEDLLLKNNVRRFLKYPTEMVYSASKKQLIVAGGDIYSFKI